MIGAASAAVPAHKPQSSAATHKRYTWCAAPYGRRCPGHAPPGAAAHLEAAGHITPDRLQDKKTSHACAEHMVKATLVQVHCCTGWLMATVRATYERVSMHGATLRLSPGAMPGKEFALHAQSLMLAAHSPQLLHLPACLHTQLIWQPFHLGDNLQIPLTMPRHPKVCCCWKPQPHCETCHG